MRVLAPKWRIPRLLLLALVLLFVQTGAMLHAYSHRDPARQDGAAGTEQCLYCKASAPLLGAAAAPALLALLLPILLWLRLPVLKAAAAAVFRHPAFRSRAPPQLY